ncbi:hypothetical protein Tco_0756430 [Tanacetum coccineum]
MLIVLCLALSRILVLETSFPEHCCSSVTEFSILSYEKLLVIEFSRLSYEKFLLVSNLQLQRIFHVYSGEMCQLQGVPESMEHDSCLDASATGHPIAEPKSVQSKENHAPPAMLQFAKTRKLFTERCDLN